MQNSRKIFNIAVIGAGYVGIPTGFGLARFGHKITIIDKNEERITSLMNGIMPIYESGLEDLYAEVKNNLSFSDKMANSANSDIIFLAVNTPSDIFTGQTDLTYLELAAKELAQFLKEDAVVVIKSTVPVGTLDKISSLIYALIKKRIHFVSNPEFLREGFALHDFFHPDRVVIGTKSLVACDVMTELYCNFRDKLLFVSPRSSELIKHASNAFLATKISFINEMGRLCEKVGANIMELANGIGMDNRIGKAFLSPGPSWGGSCFPKDTISLLHVARNNDVALNVVDAAVTSNKIQRQFVLNKILYFADKVCAKRISVLGTAFKAGTDDIRDSVSIFIIEELLKNGYEINTYDPKAMSNTRDKFQEKVGYYDSALDCMKRGDITVIMTEWKEFMELNLGDIRDAMGGRVLIDFRNLFNSQDMINNKIHYNMLGYNIVT